MSEPQDTPSRHSDQYPIRLPDGMRDEIKQTAKKNNRSMNAEIVARLSESFGSAETLRDRFAMAALTGLSPWLTRSGVEKGRSAEEAAAITASVAFEIADAMMAVRAEGGAV